ncbi:MAG: protein kinase [Dokdonella sp.]
MKQRLGHYDIVAELGRGGMGVVYKGHESRLNRYVAIKVLADALAHDEGVKERFLREARSMASLNDPHIIQIYFISEDEGQTYFVMEFVEGESLSSMLKRDGRLGVEPAGKVIYQTALGLATAHDHGVIHRDIKPGNLMINTRGSVKIADFGIALFNQDLSKKLTTTGEFVGTPGYLSPEVCLGKPVDQRSDIFSLGIVLFEMLTGRMPFTEESPLGLMLEVVRAEIPDVRELNSDVDPEIARILGKMIAKEPADRYQTCHELADDLARHPLVGRSGGINLAPQMSTAAATVIGMRTPMPPLASSPATAPTPMPVSASAGAPAAPLRASALDRPASSTARKSGNASALPWAIAAIVLLGVAGGAWAMRDRIPLLAHYFNSSPLNANAADSPAATAATATSSSNPPSAIPATTLATTPPNAASPAPSSDNSNAQASVGQALNTSMQNTQADQGSSDHAVTDAPDPARADDRTPVTVAKISPPPETAPARPRIPTIAIATSGDDVIAEPARDALIQQLQRRGFRVIESNAGGQPNMRSLAGKADAVVVIQARAVGSQEMTYYGQSSTLYTVQLGVKAYKVSDGRVLWTSGADQVNFTTLNAAEKAREAVEPLIDRVEENLAEFRPRGRG